MKLTVSVPCPSSSLKPELLVRFLRTRLSAITEPDSTEPPPVLLSLILAVGFQEKGFHDPLKEQITSSDNAETILKMYKDLFVPALWGQSLDDKDRAEENPFPNEQSCQLVLRYALDEGARILAERDFQFLEVVKLLTRTGLSCYSYRLYQFECACRFFQDDEENLVRKGVEIIEDALGIPRNEN